MKSEEQLPLDDGRGLEKTFWGIEKFYIINKGAYICKKNNNN